jgi:hypothetical protein
VSKRFDSAAGRYSVQMPGTLKSTSDNQDVHGESIVMYESYAETDSGNVAYMVIYSDYPADLANDPADVVLKQCQDGAVKGKTLLTDRNIDLNGVPGRAYTAVDSDGSKFDVHEYFVNKRLYQVMVVADKGYTAPYRDLFMNSFTIK